MSESCMSHASYEPTADLSRPADFFEFESFFTLGSASGFGGCWLTLSICEVHDSERLSGPSLLSCL